MFAFNPAPKPKHSRKIDKRAKRTEFVRETREAIAERDQGCCVRCGVPAVHIHHISYRSQLTDDVSSKRNGVCVCHKCHEFAHGSREGREWFKHWKEKYLDENGDYIELPFSDYF